MLDSRSHMCYYQAIKRKEVHEMYDEMMAWGAALEDLLAEAGVTMEELEEG